MTEESYANPRDAELRHLLISASSIAVVGASSEPDRPSNEIMGILIDAGFDVIPINPNEETILGRRVYPSLDDVPQRIDIVDVFRRVAGAPAIARQAVHMGARALWLQLGLVSEEAAAIAKAAGMIVVMDRCIGQTVLRLGIKRVAPPVIVPVEVAGIESFAASDPPAWAPPGSRQRRKC